MGSCFGKPKTGERQSLIESLRSNTPPVVDIVPPFPRSRNDPTQFFLDPRRCTVNWMQPETTVGVVNVAEIRLICRNGSSYSYSGTDFFQADVINNDTGREINCIIEPTTLINATRIRVSFTVLISGTYRASFMINGQILDRIHVRNYQPGPPDPNRTIFHLHATNLVFKCSTFFPILFSPRDSYGNSANVTCELLFLEARKNGYSGEVLLPECIVQPVENEEGRYEMLVKLDDPGHYICCIKYMDRLLGLHDTNVICLTEENSQRMENNLTSQFLTSGYSAFLIPFDSTKRPKDVKLFLSPRLLQIREYTLFIPSRVFTCRVCNSTQFTLHSEQNKFTIDDGLQPPVTLASPDRDTIAAVFYRFIQRNIGGTESFQDKVKHFHQELQKRNPEDERREVRISVNRFNLVESSMQATRGFSNDMWKRLFSVRFEGESGIDIGGVGREFFNSLCDVLFGGRNPRGLFACFNNDSQSLVHPNCRRDKSLLTLEHYKFAGRIVGKCLYDTAKGNRLLVKAKFTRSFLAQIIGLRLSWKHFETDDPDLYRHKVVNIRDGDIEELDLDLTFAEEVFSLSGSTDPRLISLTPGGSKTAVTDGNKMEYLNQLAQYRLGRCVADEVKSFLKGLHDIIPDDLLAMFDENELELLMCGVQEIDVHDLHTHAQVRSGSQDFERVVSWFWTAIEEFNQEQLARLVQFVTGSSQIPTGGFGELRPPFLLAPSGEIGNRLPYAHTCFNHLCLPISDTYEQFRASLMTAINEGCEGVLLA